MMLLATTDFQRLEQILTVGLLADPLTPPNHAPMLRVSPSDRSDIDW
jgi:hypothetical protein